MFRYGLVKLLLNGMNSCRGRTPIVKIRATLWSRGSKSNGSEIESKNGFDEHHASGVHNRFSGFEIIQRVREDWAGGEVQGDTALYSSCSSGLLIYSKEWRPSH